MTGAGLGATMAPGGIDFRVWAPEARQVELQVEHPRKALLPMQRWDDGTWWIHVEGGVAGLRYRYRLDGGNAFPDPYSRHQPQGVHGPSEVVDTGAFAWHDAGWAGVQPKDLVIYECHIGSFTPEGTFEAAAAKLAYLRELGVTALEIMPVAECPGHRNWGYDGVSWFAPNSSYGGPNGLQRLVEAAHEQGLAVLLDVVYNHFGPEGNYTGQFSRQYVAGGQRTAWGEALNYDGPGSEWMRKLAIDNACYWLRDYHIDGLRLDATFAIRDGSPRHILAELAAAARRVRRNAILIAETHENDVRYLRSEQEGGFGFDAVWADDFHHGMRRCLAGDRHGYYADYTGTVEDIARTLNQGFLYEGQHSQHLGQPRGTAARDRPAWQFIYCLENHDQVGNRAFGDRLNHGIDAARFRAASALLLLAPYTPLLFMGQEFAASTPFLYFTDHEAGLGKLVTRGRRREFAAFPAFSSRAARARIPDPQAVETFLACKLRWQEADHSPMLALYRRCLALRREDTVLQGHDRFAARAWAVTPEALALLYEADTPRLLIVNLGEAIAPTWQALGTPMRSRVLLNTDDEAFGGAGAGVRASAGGVSVPARTAVLLG